MHFIHNAFHQPKSPQYFYCFSLRFCGKYENMCFLCSTYSYRSLQESGPSIFCASLAALKQEKAEQKLDTYSLCHQANTTCIGISRKLTWDHCTIEGLEAILPTQNLLVKECLWGWREESRSHRTDTNSLFSTGLDMLSSPELFAAIQFERDKFWALALQHLTLFEQEYIHSVFALTRIYRNPCLITAVLAVLQLTFHTIPLPAMLLLADIS